MGIFYASDDFIWMSGNPQQLIEGLKTHGILHMESTQLIY